MQATELWDEWGASIYELEVYDTSYEPPVEEDDTYVVLTRNATVSGESTGLKEGDGRDGHCQRRPAGLPLYRLEHRRPDADLRAARFPGTDLHHARQQRHPDGGTLRKTGHRPSRSF